MTTLFVTATGTEVGKTFVCCRLIEVLGRDAKLRVIKPMASGIDAADLAGTDTGLLLQAQGKAVDREQFELATPWHFRAPLAPDMAAAREGRRIPFDELVAFSRDAGDGSLTIIEGIGGAMVPIDDTHTVLDWMMAVAPVVWLVAGSYLGSISHTLATQRVIEAAGLELGAVVVCESDDAPASLGEIAAVLRRFTGAVPVVELSRPPAASQLTALTELLQAQKN